MYLKAIMASEVIADKVFEDLFSPFRSLYYALTNNLVAFNFFLSLEKINLHTQFSQLQMFRRLKEGFAKPKAKLILTLGKNVKMNLCLFLIFLYKI